MIQFRNTHPTLKRTSWHRAAPQARTLELCRLLRQTLEHAWFEDYVYSSLYVCLCVHVYIFYASEYTSAGQKSASVSALCNSHQASWPMSFLESLLSLPPVPAYSTGVQTCVIMASYSWVLWLKKNLNLVYYPCAATASHTNPSSQPSHLFYSGPVSQTWWLSNAEAPVEKANDFEQLLSHPAYVFPYISCYSGLVLHADRGCQ